MPLWIAGPAGAALPAAGGLPVGGGDRDHRRLAAAHASARPAGQQARGHGERAARPQGRGGERRAAGQQRGQHLLGVADHGGADRAVRRRRHRLRHARDRRHGGDLRRGDAQDLGAAARRPRGAGAGAVDRRDARRARPNGARRRLDLALLPQAAGRARRPHAGRRRACRRAARRHRPAWPRPGRRDGARREGDAAARCSISATARWAT